MCVVRCRLRATLPERSAFPFVTPWPRKTEDVVPFISTKSTKTVGNSAFHARRRPLFAVRTCSFDRPGLTGSFETAARAALTPLQTQRERVLFIGTQFSILYTSMYSPAEAATQTV